MGYKSTKYLNWKQNFNLGLIGTLCACEVRNRVTNSVVLVPLKFTYKQNLWRKYPTQLDLSPCSRNMSSMVTLYYCCGCLVSKVNVMSRSPHEHSRERTHGCFKQQLFSSIN